jgi:hypothetical protein
MTLREHYLHDNNLRTNEIKNQKIVKSTQSNVNDVVKSGYYNPDAARVSAETMDTAAYEKPSYYSGKKLADMPQMLDDSRSLLEQRFSVKIETNDQVGVKAELLSIFIDALSACEARKNIEGDKARSRYFQGIREALMACIRDMRDGNTTCLYDLCEKYQRLSDTIQGLIKDETFHDHEDSDNSKSYHLGIASGYLNASDMIKGKLAIAENEKYRVFINQSQLNA